MILNLIKSIHINNILKQITRMFICANPYKVLSYLFSLVWLLNKLQSLGGFPHSYEIFFIVLKLYHLSKNRKAVKNRIFNLEICISHYGVEAINKYSER